MTTHQPRLSFTGYLHGHEDTSLPSCITIFFHWIPLSAIPMLRVNRTYFQTSKVVHHSTADSLVASYIFVSSCFFPISRRCWGVAGAPGQRQIQLVCIYTWTSLKRHHGSSHACLNGRIWDDSRCPETMHGLGLRWHPRSPNLYSGGKLSCLIPFNFHVSSSRKVHQERDYTINFNTV